MLSELEEQAVKLAYRTALNSKDPSTQNGAVLIAESVSGNKVVYLSTAQANNFPNNVKTCSERWDRPLKYNYVEHAERNAIYVAASKGIKTEGSTLVCPWAACSDCARAIIQAGVKKLIRHSSSSDKTNPRWAETIEIADTMMHEAGVEVLEFDKKFDLEKIRRDGGWFYP